MSTFTTAAQPQTRQNQGPRRGGRRGRSRGRGGAPGGSPKADRMALKDDQSASMTAQEKAVGDAKAEAKDEAVVPDASSQSGDADVCWICAEPVKYYSVSECNHRTCHVCALRLRALYKKTDCTFCKEPQPSVIFTTSADASFSSFTPESIPFKDAKLSIFFETQEMMEETLILLRFNCPDPDCDYIGNGWGDLKLHVRATHGKLMCDLCLRHKKVFAHEHALYPPSILPVHLPSLHYRHPRSVPKDQVEGGIHPLCEFCRECFFGDDELYAHMRERHEECFICKRNEVRDQYFQNYESLERHFNQAHHPCIQPVCLARKFVVFNSALDLKAHMVEEHGADMSARDKKDARRVLAEFEFEEVGVGGRHGRRDRQHRERDREPPPEQRHHPQEHPPPSVLPRPPGVGGRRREGFGTNLTVEGGSTPSPDHVTPHQSRPPSPPLGDVDPAVAERHAAFIARLQSLAANPATAVPVVKAAIRGYRSSESSARDLISTIWNVFDENLEHTASIVNSFVDIIDSEEKKQDLLASWKGFAIEQRREFPDLVPTSTGSAYAGIASGRVLNAKHSTASRSSQQSSRQVWDRVARAAASSSSSSSLSSPAQRPGLGNSTQERFPALQASSSTQTGTSRTPMFRQPQRSTPWASSSASYRPAPPAPPPTTPQTNQSVTVVPNPHSALAAPAAGGGKPRKPPPKLSSALFPELPSAPPKPKAPVSGNQSLKNILGTPAGPSVLAWQSGTAPAASAGASSGAAQATEGDVVAPVAGKGKKGKGKQKQTLFTLGSFPT